MTVTRFAAAKINLHLHVGLPLADGRHPLDSLVVFAADAGDTVVATDADDLSLRVTGPFVTGLGAGEDNLVMRAARLLAEHAGVAPRATLHLEKNLPIASGIGGGSADAAAALHALDALWRIRAGVVELAELSARLGADLPVCVHGRTAMMRATGEDTVPVAFPALHAVLVNPGVEAATGAVYRMFDTMKLGAGFQPAGAPPADPAAARDWLAQQRNDLEAPAREVAPLIGETLAVLRTHAPVALVRMSGSGATCFAVVDDAASADAIARDLAAARPGWWVRATALG